MGQLLLCPKCGQESFDREFCDHCNAEIAQVDCAVRSLPTAVTLSDGSVLDCTVFDEKWPADPEQAISISHRAANARIYAIRPDIWPILERTVEERRAMRAEALPPIEVVGTNGGGIVVADAWGVESAEQTFISQLGGDCISVQLQELVQRCKRIEKVLSQLHTEGYVWLNFDPAALEISAGGIRITNLDLTLFPSGQCPERFRVSAQYSPPEVCRFQGDRVGATTDVFHLAVYAYYALAGLLPTGFPGRGLEAFRFDVPPLRVYRPTLPIRLWPIIKKGLSVDAKLRQASTADFLNELDQAVVRITSGAERATSSIPPPSNNWLWAGLRRFFRRRWTTSSRHALPGTRLDFGYCTDAGLVKTSLGLVNQDAVVVKQFRHRGRQIMLALVADGVSTARVGSGDLASQIACHEIPNFILTASDGLTAGDGETGTGDWKTLLESACVAASEAIVTAALQTSALPPDVQDSDLMSSTALIGVLDDDSLHLANVGDSRAYVVADGFAEQLTVDGDVGTSMLASGEPPEQAIELGAQAKALRYCLGACIRSADGSITCDRSRSLPQYTRWRLQPGETIVLCSDGLVEEGVFLEPNELAEAVSADPPMRAQQLADNLVAAANRRQRLPSRSEPNGFGDNITCVVLRLLPADANPYNALKER